jgi:hypothetical protein
MAGPAPKTRNWAARENAHKPKGWHLIVAGLVQVTNTNKEPDLAESAERNPRNLDLALTIAETGGPGVAVLCWKQAFFHKEVRPNEYDSVTIRRDGSEIAQVPVVDDREYDQLQDAKMRAVNLKYGKAPPKAAAKKPAPKKAVKKAVAKTAAKKSGTVANAVGGWAKGVKKALKKVLKSAAGAGKTAAKKSAKKSAKKTARRAKKTARKGKR